VDESSKNEHEEMVMEPPEDDFKKMMQAFQ
jgi:hypothetical protein